MGVIRTTFHLVIATALLFTASTAFAFDTYVSGRLGMAMLEDATTTSEDLPGIELDFGYDKGIAAAGAFGWRNEDWRSEIEVSYQQNDLDELSLGGTAVSASSAGVSGDVTALTGLVNAYWDIPTGNRFRPYLTGGVGFSNLDASLAVTSVPGVPNASASDTDTVLAYQFGAGLGYNINDNMTVDIGYRYFGTSDPSFGGVDSEFTSHNISAGFRYNF